MRPIGFWSTCTRRLIAFEPFRDVAAAHGRCGAFERVEFLVVLGDVMAEMRRPTQFHQHLAHQARLAGARNAGDGREHAERKLHIDVVQVVARDIGQAQPAVRRPRRARRRGVALAEQIATRMRGLDACAAPRAARCRARGRRARPPPGRRPRSSPHAASHRLRARPRTANCRHAFNCPAPRSSASVSAGCRPADGSSST